MTSTRAIASNLALRTLLRYAVPLAVLALLAAGPWLYIAIQLRPPRDLPQARAALRLAWILAATGWIAPFVLAGAAAPLVRAVAAGTPPSQLRALGTGLVHLVRAIVPCLAALVAVAIGALALVLPGLALLVLLALTGASAERGMPGPLLDSAAVVRARPRPVLAVVAAIIAVPLAVAFIGQYGLVLVKGLRPEQLAPIALHVRGVAIAIAVAAPLGAALLAAIHARAPRVA